VDRLLVAARLDTDEVTPTLLSPGVDQQVQDLFGPSVLERRYAEEWPGTQLIGHQGVVWTVAYSERLFAPMIAAANLLRSWRHSHNPPLPEDICLFRQGDSLPVLVSVTHEEEAWLITDREVDLPGAEAADAGVLEYIPPAATGFVGS
jgi:hypothetical protein